MHAILWSQIFQNTSWIDSVIQAGYHPIILSKSLANNESYKALGLLSSKDQEDRARIIDSKSAIKDRKLLLSSLRGDLDLETLEVHCKSFKLNIEQVLFGAFFHRGPLISNNEVEILFYHDEELKVRKGDIVIDGNQGQLEIEGYLEETMLQLSPAMLRSHIRGMQKEEPFRSLRATKKE